MDNHETSDTAPAPGLGLFNFGSLAENPNDEPIEPEESEEAEESEEERHGEIGHAVYELAATSKESAGDVLENMTTKQALRFFEDINKNVCKELKIDKDARTGMLDRSFRKNGHSYVAPRPVQQIKLFREYFKAIQANSENKDEQALLAYYAINNLHLFPGGNEATAQAVYLWLRHNTDISSDKSGVKVPEQGGDDADEDAFCAEHHIRRTEWINKIANAKLQSEMIEHNTLMGKSYNSVKLLDPRFSGKSIIVESASSKDNLAYPMMSKKDKGNLGGRWFRNLQYAVTDESGASWAESGLPTGSSLAGLAMASTFSRIGLPKKIIEACDNPVNRNAVKIEVNYTGDDDIDADKNVRNRAIDSMYAHWGSSDSRYASAIYEKLKKAQNEKVISFFTEKTSFYKEETVVDVALNR